jgi:hypothetical protein
LSPFFKHFWRHLHRDRLRNVMFPISKWTHAEKRKMFSSSISVRVITCNDTCMRMSAGKTKQLTVRQRTLTLIYKHYTHTCLVDLKLHLHNHSHLYDPGWTRTACDYTCEYMLTTNSSSGTPTTSRRGDRVWVCCSAYHTTTNAGRLPSLVVNSTAHYE